MRKVIKTTANAVWIDDGIIHIQANGSPSTGDTVNETLKVIRDLIEFPGR